MNSSDRDEQKRAFVQWKNNLNAYKEYEASIADNLPKGIVSFFRLHDNFHDCPIKEIHIYTNRKKKLCCNIVLMEGNKNIALCLHDVCVLNVNVLDLDWCIQHQLSWGYCEFSYLPEDKISLSVLCDVENEFYFEFSDLSITEK